jgi:hypothetical protein
MTVASRALLSFLFLRLREFGTVRGQWVLWAGTVVFTKLCGCRGAATPRHATPHHGFTFRFSRSLGSLKLALGRIGTTLLYVTYHNMCFWIRFTDPSQDSLQVYTVSSTVKLVDPTAVWTGCHADGRVPGTCEWLTRSPDTVAHDVCYESTATDQATLKAQ